VSLFGRRNVFGGSAPGNGGAGMAGVSINLTALMDILSNLLFFLLASYTSQSVELESQSGLKLPSSTSRLSLTPQITITVTDSRIDVGGVPVGSIQHGQIVEPLDRDGNVGALYDRLDKVKASRQAAGRADMADAALVLLLADRGTDSETITRVLKTAGRAGFYNVRFGVISR
jgi:biopolymer transport protein ExbD